jgi:thymidylate kinase
MDMASVALIGPDGAGKTTIARMLEERGSLRFKYLYMGVNTESSNLALPTSRLVNRMKRRNGSSHAGVPRARGRLWMGARLVHHLAEEGFRQLACWYYELSGRVVLCDRHFVFDYSPEIMVDANHAFDRRVRRWVFAHLFPQPDLVIFLDAPGEVLFMRKGDATITDLERRRQAYLTHGDRVPNFVRVDASRPLHEVYDQVFEHILRFRRATSSRERLAGKIDHLRSRFFYKALDASTTAELRSPHRATPSLSSVLRLSTSAYESVRWLVRTTNGLMPGTSRWIRRALVQASYLPCNGVVELIGFGSGSTVYLLHDAESERTGEPAHVLKIYRRSLGRRLPALLELAEEFHTKYRTISTWYGGGSLVQPTHFAVVHAPILDQPAVACFQPYIAGSIEDFFARTDAELLALLTSNERLRSQFHAFAAGTLRALEQEGRCVDLLGPGNLALIGSAGEHRLCLLDFGIFDLAQQNRKAPQLAARIRELAERIRSLHDAARRAESRPSDLAPRGIAD